MGADQDQDSGMKMGPDLDMGPDMVTVMDI
jgi:hypothetical protein